MNWFTKFFSKKDKSHCLAELTRQRTKQRQKELEKENEEFVEECCKYFLDQVYSYIEKESNQGKYSVSIYLPDLFCRRYYLDDKCLQLANKIRLILKKEGFRTYFRREDKTILFICWE